ncbi:hypothetical protein Kpol_1050p9 [Vanderwaltozyma polyspora DSM 70294]|uniref:Uncharacterized protein n=1 Tax=Vanderwaltozyma polyspora (strain ATCC 22028 / DSM 70294 / BCRC 21397 / CBS 2163 / NBRC 10782 / NRRL Y-8283 / UCD 57-17) TaxID=436907 RepID=A7TEQ6_VANPO|nr:uncharacterized protein Kpol_1050p9 [Vanderwaltozyma polyspora DSM 70294]EDO19152.1 hypothetical protein Kpol_1050p9 [Vanderwaltozyma polyspora DSM 70294]
MEKDLRKLKIPVRTTNISSPNTDNLLNSANDKENFSFGNPKLFLCEQNQPSALLLNSNEQQEHKLDDEIFNQIKVKCKNLTAIKHRYKIKVKLEGNLSLSEIAGIYKFGKFCIFCADHPINIKTHRCTK